MIFLSIPQESVAVGSDKGSCGRHAFRFFRCADHLGSGQVDGGVGVDEDEGAAEAGTRYSHRLLDPRRLSPLVSTAATIN